MFLTNFGGSSRICTFFSCEPRNIYKLFYEVTIQQTNQPAEEFKWFDLIETNATSTLHQGRFLRGDI